MSWKLAVVDAQGDPAEIHLAPARVEPAPVTVPVPVEWVNKVVRRMLAMEKVIRRAVSGLPLDLHYPAPTPLPVQPLVEPRSQAQSRAAPRKKSAWAPPQKKIATRTFAPTATTQRQTSSARQAAGDLQTAREGVARVERKYLMKMREKPTQVEPIHKKK